MPAILTVAYWAAKWTAARATGTAIKTAAAPWFTPWVIVPLLMIGGVIFANHQINSAYERGDLAGYDRRSGEVNALVAQANAAIASATTDTAALLAANDAARNQLLADVKRMSAEVSAQRDQATAKDTAIRSLNLENQTLRKSKVRVVEKPVVKTRTVVRNVNVACAVNDEIVARLNNKK